MARIVARYRRIALTGDYADVWMDVRVNPPMRVFDDFESKDMTRIRGALGGLVQGSNLEDEDGTPIDLTTENGWKAAPADFLTIVANALIEAMGGAGDPKAPEAATPSSSPTSPTVAPPLASTPSSPSAVLSA